jgi:hypothetical protein
MFRFLGPTHMCAQSMSRRGLEELRLGAKKKIMIRVKRLELS